MARTKATRKYAGKQVDNEGVATLSSKRDPAPPRPEQTEYDETLAPRDPSLLSDTFSQAIKRHYGDSTSIEQGDLHLASRAFKDTTSFGNPRVAKEIPEYIKTFLNAVDDDPSTCKEAGAPHTIIVASSGIRVADLTRSLTVFNSAESKVTKYFASHMKLSKNVEFSKSTKVGIAVGTPHRLKQLIQENAIKVSSIERIIVDGSYQNEKKYTIFDLLESFKAMLELLNITEVKARLLDDDDKLQVMVF